MRLPAILTGLFLCVVVFSAQNSKVSAEVPQQLIINSSTNIANELAVLEVVEAQSIPEVSKPIEHQVAEGETLTQVAEKYETTWQRLYAKNLNVADPNIVAVGEKVVIPLPDEQLPDRALPEPPEAPASTKRAKAASYTASRGSSSGNTYIMGYCTWYAKSRRPDLPNNLGNADTWVSRASAQGIPTGSAPRAGAIGQQGMHVVYVERVNADGTVFVSEMNYNGFGVVSSRNVAASNFMYIY